MRDLAKLFVLILLFICSIASADKLSNFDNAGLKAYEAGDYATAFKNYLIGAQHRDVNAQVLLGNLYDTGEGIPQDHVKAFEWYSKAAQNGYSIAQSFVGRDYYYGIGVQQDYAKALYWFTKAAKQGEAISQYGLGSMYAQGVGVQQDYPKANYWFMKSAQQGYKDAQYNLGVSYLNGYGVSKDDTKAAEWFHKAAAQGDKDAQNSLGMSYEHGYGVHQDYMQAVAWYKKAAEQGDAEAQYNLGVMYFRGHGVRQDPKEAAIWFYKAAGEGLVNAQDNLGVLYEYGLGVPKNYIAAYALYNIAAAQDNDNQTGAATNRSRLMSSMTSAQVDDGQSLTRQMQRIGVLKALDLYLNNGTQLAHASSNADTHTVQSKNYSNAKYYLKQVLGPNGHIDKKLHDQFWQQFNGESEQDVSLEINWIKGSLLTTKEFEKELWKSALLSYDNHQVIKTERLIQLEKDVPEMAKKSLPWPPGSAQYNENLAGFNSGWTTSMEDAKRLLNAAASHKNFITVNGTEVHLDKNGINQASSSIDASIARFKKLLDRKWNGN